MVSILGPTVLKIGDFDASNYIPTVGSSQAPLEYTPGYEAPG
jgi:hypothetical protein